MHFGHIQPWPKSNYYHVSQYESVVLRGHSFSQKTRTATGGLGIIELHLCLLQWWRTVLDLNDNACWQSKSKHLFQDSARQWQGIRQRYLLLLGSAVILLLSCFQQTPYRHMIICMSKRCLPFMVSMLCKPVERHWTWSEWASGETRLVFYTFLGQCRGSAKLLCMYIFPCKWEYSSKHALEKQVGFAIFCIFQIFRR
jgi:hypothetical protein